MYLRGCLRLYFSKVYMYRKLKILILWSKSHNRFLIINWNQKTLNALVSYLSNKWSFAQTQRNNAIHCSFWYFCISPAQLFSFPLDASLGEVPLSFWWILGRRGFRSPCYPHQSILSKMWNCSSLDHFQTAQKNTTTKNTCVNQKMSLNLKTSTLFIIFTTFTFSSQASALQTFCCCCC